MAIQNTILTNLKTQLETLAWPNLVSFDKIRISANDFRDHEIPVIQFYPTAFNHIHNQGRLLTEMAIVVEIILKQDASGVVSVGDLLDKMQDVEQKVGEDVRLGITSSMIGVKYLGAETDLHMIEPFYIGALTFVAEFYKPYTGSC
ncbi:MAG: hypothetical protein ACE5DQ_01715 [Candidatus Paceibacterota bacterium]